MTKYIVFLSKEAAMALLLREGGGGGGGGGGAFAPNAPSWIRHCIASAHATVDH